MKTCRLVRFGVPCRKNMSHRSDPGLISSGSTLGNRSEEALRPLCGSSRGCSYNAMLWTRAGQTALGSARTLLRESRVQKHLVAEWRIEQAAFKGPKLWASNPLTH